MAVHAQSVIPTWLNTWDPVLYTKLTDQEEYCYTGPTSVPIRAGDNPSNWIPVFTNLVNALTSWKTSNRQSLLTDLIPMIYSYNTLNFLYGTGNSLNATSGASNVFTINGFPTTSKARATDYYTDLVTNGKSGTNGSFTLNGNTLTTATGGITGATFVGGTLHVYTGGSVGVYPISGTPTATVVTITGTFPAAGTGIVFSLKPAAGATSSSVKVAADVTTINGFAANETSIVSGIKSGLQAVVSAHVSKSLFEDPAVVGSFPGKAGMATQVFTTMGYKTAYQVLNVGSLTLPPGV